MDLLAIVDEVRRNWLDYERNQPNDNSHPRSSKSSWSERWGQISIQAETHEYFIPGHLKIDKKLLSLMRNYHSYFIRSDLSNSFPGLIFAQPWDVHSQEIADVATHERKYEKFKSLLSSQQTPGGPNPVAAMQALAEASRRPLPAIDPTIDADSNQKHHDGARYATETIHQRPKGPRNTDELRHGSMRMTDEAIASTARSQYSYKSRYGSMRTTDEAIASPVYLPNLYKPHHDSLRPTDEASPSLHPPLNSSQEFHHGNLRSSDEALPAHYDRDGSARRSNTTEHYHSSNSTMLSRRPPAAQHSSSLAKAMDPRSSGFF